MALRPLADRGRAKKNDIRGRLAQIHRAGFRAGKTANTILICPASDYFCWLECAKSVFA
jgi:hypothetical protein